MCCVICFLLALQLAHFDRSPLYALAQWDHSQCSYTLLNLCVYMFMLWPLKIEKLGDYQFLQTAAHHW